MGLKVIVVYLRQLITWLIFDSSNCRQSLYGKKEKGFMSEPNRHNLGMVQYCLNMICESMSTPFEDLHIQEWKNPNGRRKASKVSLSYAITIKGFRARKYILQ